MLHLLYFVLKICTYENKSHLVFIIKQSNTVTYRTPKEAVAYYDNRGSFLNQLIQLLIVARSRFFTTILFEVNLLYNGSKFKSPFLSLLEHFFAMGGT